ncbi:hypothetical protein NP493_692g06011 [Ridgeia piscesae]|uniref:L-xylulose reductase n=1 Tax=Ridgeia piscesae TaxID=27915 RepID=A0AAD9KQT6_RIDPI|nr:hypothetical protein NP493_692g06011 [Ridgeia piscesae]
MDIRFDGKRPLVTGAGKSIGKGIAEALFAGGAETYALSRTHEDLDKLEAENPGMHTVCVDLSDWATARKAVEQIGSVDLLVNNAGINELSPFLETEESQLNKILDINVKAVINVSQVVAKRMIDRGNGGAIVHISSRASQEAVENHLSYCATKGALDQVMRVMALELGPHQIRVNCVNPIIVMTRMGTGIWSDPVKSRSVISRIPQGKCAEVKNVVHSVLYLLSDKADMINGVTLMVDGGKAIT